MLTRHARLLRQSEHEFVIAEDRAMRFVFTVVKDCAENLTLHRDGQATQGKRKP